MMKNKYIKKHDLHRGPPQTRGRRPRVCNRTEVGANELASVRPAAQEVRQEDDEGDDQVPPEQDAPEEGRQSEAWGDPDEAAGPVPRQQP